MFAVIKLRWKVHEEACDPIQVDLSLYWKVSENLLERETIRKIPLNELLCTCCDFACFCANNSNFSQVPIKT